MISFGRWQSWNNFFFFILCCCKYESKKKAARVIMQCGEQSDFNPLCEECWCDGVAGMGFRLSKAFQSLIWKWKSSILIRSFIWGNIYLALSWFGCLVAISCETGVRWSLLNISDLCTTFYFSINTQPNWISHSLLIC